MLHRSSDQADFLIEIYAGKLALGSGPFPQCHLTCAPGLDSSVFICSREFAHDQQLNITFTFRAASIDLPSNDGGEFFHVTGNLTRTSY